MGISQSINVMDSYGDRGGATSLDASLRIGVGDAQQEASQFLQSTKSRARFSRIGSILWGSRNPIMRKSSTAAPAARDFRFQI